MRLSYANKFVAQSIAERIFFDMQAAGALEPGTTSWALPRQDKDKDGNPTDSLWHVAVDGRCRPFLTAEEIARIPEWAEVEP